MATTEDELFHIGTPHDGVIPHSGRWPYGSGVNAFQHPKDFYTYVAGLRKDGLSDEDIRKLCGDPKTGKPLPKDAFQHQLSYAKRAKREYERDENQKLIDQGMDNRSERARKLSEILGYPYAESMLRNLESGATVSKDERAKATYDVLKKEVDEKKMLDVGKGVPTMMGITEDRLKVAVEQLVNEGYVLHSRREQQFSDPTKTFPMTILCEPGTEYSYLMRNFDKIGVPGVKFESPQGTGLLGLVKPKPVDPKTVSVVYGEEGARKDGIIELRPGIKDLDLGSANYAQVRINVGDTHYLKGVAVYADDLPPGINIRFNTNKPEGTPLLGPKSNSVLKPMKHNPETGEIDWDNPFGAAIKKGGQKGALNIVNEEGDWQEWGRTLSAQFLSKQSESLARRQLDLASKERKEEFDEIMSLTNPIVKQNLLYEFGEKCDRAAIQLKASAMPNQSTAVLIPIDSMKEHECYARSYETGTKVCLVRYPHGGIFEIPELTVNNRNKEAGKLLGATTDAIGINHKVAQQLSGADFDGDTVVVIPNPRGEIQTKKILDGLKDFDPKIYKMSDKKEGMSEQYKQQQMGVVSNLITDMTIKGAPEEHLVRAVKHSMVVIDAEKHHLDWRASERDQGIAELKKLYQDQGYLDEKTGEPKYGGASTLISRANAQERVLERKSGRFYIDSATGEKSYPDYTLTGKTTVTKQGKEIPKTMVSRQMAETSDPYTLLSTANGGKGMPMERIYADYASTMKGLANQARKVAKNMEIPTVDKEAAREYQAEVRSISQKIAESKAWSPMERNANLYASSVVRAKREANGGTLDKKEAKRIRRQALQQGRARLGGKRPVLEFTEREWEALQKNALTKTQAREALNAANPDKIKELAMPRTKKGLSSSQVATIKALLASGHSYETLAKRYGVSTSTIQRAAKG